MADNEPVGPFEGEPINESQSINASNDYSIQHTYPSDKRKRFLLLTGFTILFYVGVAGSGSLWPQYLLDRLRKEANTTNESENATSLCMVNVSDPNYMHEQKLQERSASIMAAATFLGGIPNIFTVFIYGSLSDRIGRKTVIAISYVGFVLNNLALNLLVNLHTPIYIYFISSFINGLCGSSPTMLAAMFAYVADVTPPEKRGIAIAIIEGSLAVAAVITSLLVGWSIKLISFGHSMIWLNVVVALSIVFLIPLQETRRFQNEMKEVNKTEKLHQRIWTILMVKASDMKQLLVVSKRRSICLLSLAGIMLIFTLAYMGTMSTSSLYLMNRPFCWNSVLLGYYSSVKIAVVVIGTTVLMILFKKRLTGIAFILLGTTFFAITFAIQGIASIFPRPMCDIFMIISTATSFCLMLVPILVRTVSSKLVSKDEQGAAFGFIAAAESFSFSFGPTIMSAIYSATVETFGGFVFVLCAGLQVIVVILSIIYKYLSRHPQNYEELLESVAG